MELADLRAFVRIAEAGSISEAARLSKQPKSSVSRALARLEDSLGAALVDRSSRHLRLTDAGRLLRPLAARLLDQADDARAALDGLAERPRGKLTVNAPFTFAVGVIAPMLPAFLERYPDIDVALDIDNKVIDLHASDVDLAVRIGTLADSELVARKLAAVGLWICASPDYLARHGTPTGPTDLVHHRLVARVDETSRWGFGVVDGERVHIDVPPRIVVPEPSAMMALVAGGAGIGRLPDFLARDAVEDGRLVRLFTDIEPERVDVHALYTSRRALSVKARVFIEALAEAAS